VDGDPLALLHPPLARWFRETLGAPTPAQAQAIPALARGEHVLVSSPTGSGKTLAGFLVLLSDLARLAQEGALEPRPHAVYVSPLKALAHDVARNLQRPLEGMAAEHARLGLPDPGIRVAIRTGDTPPSERARQLRAPPHVVVTTPESLALLLSSEGWRRHLRSVRWVVVDEIHDLAASKRGAHLSLLLERLDALASSPPVRVGLSATASPLDEVARFLAGGRPARVVEVPPQGPMEIALELAMEDPVRARFDQVEAALVERIRGIVEAHRTTLVFVNTRQRAESLALKLHAAMGDAEAPSEASADPEFPDEEPAPSVATHHGSMSREARLVVEERLKRQQVRCVVASSSLELGIDVAGVDHVVLLGSPKGVARTLQRVGRSGHFVGGVPRATLLLRDPADVPEAVALRALALARAPEPLSLPDAPLDVLSQHVAAVALEGPQRVDDAWALARRSWCYRNVSRDEFARLVARQPWVRLEGDAFHARRGARQVVLTHTGTIPDAGRVRVLEEGRFVGEVEEAFVETLEPGDVFRLGGSTWRALRAAGMALHVEAARGKDATVPDWRGEGLGMTPLLARATRDLLQTPEAIQNHLKNDSSVTQNGFQRWSAQPGFDAQEGDVEAFLDDDGRRALVVHLVAGRRVNEALARALAARLELRLVERVDAQASDLGFALLAPRRWKPTPRALADLLRDPLEPSLRAALAGSELLRRRFRHVATRMLLVLRREGVPLGQRQREANGLLARLQEEEPDHPAPVEAWRETLRHALDLDGAERAREGLAARLSWVPEGPASPRAIRVLAQMTDPEGHARIRDAEETARAFPREGGKGVPRRFGEAVENGPQDASRPEGATSIDPTSS